jgi:hypothetical protein
LDVGPFGPWSRREAVGGWDPDDPIFADLPAPDSDEPRSKVGSGLPPALAEVEWIYRVLGTHGFDPTEVDEWELWQIARFVGIGPDSPPVVIRGSRALALRSDPGAGSGGDGLSGSNLDARAAEAKARHEARQRKG